MSSGFYAHHMKKEFSNRAVVCAACIRESDDQLGFSFSLRTCCRCQKTVDVGVVVSEPRPVKGPSPK